MILEEKIYSHITTTVAISNIIDTRCYPLELPQRPIYPAIVYDRVSTVPWNDRDRSDTHTARYQIDCYAKDYLAVQTLANTIWNAMIGLRNASSPRILDVKLAARRDDDQNETMVHKVSMDFFIMFDQE